MKCLKCNTDNPKDFRYCQECGEELPQLVICPDCSHHNQIDFKFCMSCGHDLQPSISYLETGQAVDQGQAQQLPPKPHEQPQPSQPSVVIIQEPQRSSGSNFIKFLTRFAVSSVIGFVIGEVWQIFLAGY